MKSTILVTAFFIIALSVCIPGQTPSSKSDKEENAKTEVLALADAFFNASVKMDAETMELILSDDYVGIESSEDVENYSSYGLPVDKNLLIKFLKGAPQNGPRIAEIQMDKDLKSVRVYGETAVLATKITVKWQGSREELVKKYKYMPRKDDFIFTLVAVKKNDTWQIAATHKSEFQIKVHLSPDPK